MKFYQEITLIDQAEISPYFIWSKLYCQLHIALVEVKDENNQVGIGVSFPQYVFELKEDNKRIVNLGNKLRIFAQSKIELENLKIQKWLERLTDYVHITSIREVPESKITGYAVYSRKQVKTNAERLARHRVKRGDIEYDEALKRYQNVITSTDLPYIQMKSLTSDKSFKLFIAKKTVDQSPTQMFSTYGFSSESSVPEF